MAAAIIIPARYSSSRLPGKPLLKETGKYLIQHVYERASKCRFASSVLVATDDQRIATAVEHFGGKYCMTDRDHPSGTDRVAEAARHVEGDIIVNLQGDEPLIDPGCVDLLID
ncbi:MAG: cytidylyltransferase domain-containing protein, partial [Gemmataceae bacterium]